MTEDVFMTLKLPAETGLWTKFENFVVPYSIQRWLNLTKSTCPCVKDFILECNWFAQNMRVFDSFLRTEMPTYFVLFEIFKRLIYLRWETAVKQWHYFHQRWQYRRFSKHCYLYVECNQLDDVSGTIFSIIIELLFTNFAIAL